MPASGTTNRGCQERKNAQPILRIEGVSPTAQRGPCEGTNPRCARRGNKMSSHPTSKARRRRQKLKRKYARLREDCQLAGMIETTPEGAVRDEHAPVAPDPPLPHLIRQALRENWPTLDAAKPKVV